MTNENENAAAETDEKIVPAIPAGHGGKQIHESHLNIARPLATMTEFEFKFRPTKDEKGKIVYKKDATGNVLKDEKGKDIPEKRSPVKLLLPIPTVDGIHAALADEKQQSFLVDLLRDAVYDAARDQLADEELKVEGQSDLKLDRLTIAYLANIPKSQRKGGGISSETWEAFSADFNAIMPKITGKDETKISNAAKMFIGRLQSVKNVKPMLEVLKGYLNLWFASTTPENQEEFADLYKFLSEKADAFLAQDEESMLANIA